MKKKLLQFILFLIIAHIFIACDDAQPLAKNSPTAHTDTTNKEYKKDSNSRLNEEKQANLPAQEKEILPVKPLIQSVPLQHDSTKTYIYLTFDDGPHNGTKESVEACIENNIKASFFMVGRHYQQASAANQQIADKIRCSYPDLVMLNHSYSHANEKYAYFYAHPKMAEEDFYKAEQTMSIAFNIIRLPGNNAWVLENRYRANKQVKAVCQLLKTARYNVIGWDVEWRFNHKTAYPIQTVQQLVGEVNAAAKGRSFTKENVVILTHDRMFKQPQYKDSLSKFIQEIKQNPHYIFETIDHYPNLISK